MVSFHRGIINHGIVPLQAMTLKSSQLVQPPAVSPVVQGDPQPCGSGLGWVAVPSSTIHAFLLGCVNKCWVMAGECLAQGDAVFGETLSKMSRSAFCMSN